MTEPRTEAGRALLETLDDWSFHEYGTQSGHADDIAAIEAEARSLAIDRAVEACREVAALPFGNHPISREACVETFRAAVIEKLESLR